MSEEITLLKESRNQIAVRHGLPPIGALLVNQFGIEWRVDGHLYLSTLSTIARRGVKCADTEDPQDLYPVIEPLNLSPKLTRFIAETDLCTSKVIMPVDTMPALRPRSAHPESYSADGLTSPYHIILFLDAAHAHETIIAHEIGHTFIDLVLDCEDYRILKDLSDPARVFLWTNLQSFVLDQMVNQVLRERGFDMSIIEGHVEEALASLALAILSGYRPPHAREAVFLATTLASAMIDAETGAADALQSLDMATLVFQRDLPGVYELACQLAAIVRKHGYSNRAGIRKSVDACALLSFGYIGERLNLERDLVEETPTECYEDKYPTFFPGLSVPAKLEIGKAMARHKIPVEAEWRLSYSPGGSVQIQFCPKTGVWTSPVMLHHAHRIPGDTDVLRHPHSMPKGNHRMTTPLTSPVPTPRPRPTVPTFPPAPGRRTYAPGLAVFLSRVRLAEQLGGEHPYGYSNNNPITYIDPSGYHWDSKRPRRPGCDPVIYVCFRDILCGLANHEFFWVHYPCLPKMDSFIGYGPGGYTIRPEIEDDRTAVETGIAHCHRSDCSVDCVINAGQQICTGGRWDPNNYFPGLGWNDCHDFADDTRRRCNCGYRFHGFRPEAIR